MNKYIAHCITSKIFDRTSDSLVHVPALFEVFTDVFLMRIGLIHRASSRCVCDRELRSQMQRRIADSVH